MRIESLRELHGQFPDRDGFWNFDDLAQTEVNIHRLFPGEGETWTRSSLEAMTQLARAQALQGKIGEARISLDRVQELIPTLPENERVHVEMRHALEQGRLLCLVMTPARAQTFLLRAYELAMRIGNVFFAIDAALMVSLSQPPKSQDQWLQRALELAKSSADGQLWLAQLYTMDGWHFFDFRRFDLALESFEKALAQPRYAGDEAKVLIMRWCKARALRALNRVAEALEIQRSLRAELELNGKTNGHVFLELAECLQAEQKSEEARTLFELAYKELSVEGWYSDNKGEELSRIQHLSKKR